MYNILFNGSTEAKHIFILAHGAGSPMDSNFMNALALNMGYVIGLNELESDVPNSDTWSHSGFFMTLNYNIPGM